MTVEMNIVLRAIVLTAIWLFVVDLPLYKRVGMSPIFGSLKEEKIREKAKMFAFSIGFYIILMSIAITVFYKLTNRLPNNFMIWKLIIFTFGGMLLGNMLSWVGISIYLRKEDDGGNLIIALSVTGGVIVIFILGVIVAGGFPFF